MFAVYSRKLSKHIIRVAAVAWRRLARGRIPHTFSGLTMKFVNGGNAISLFGNTEDVLHGQWLLEFSKLPKL